MTQQPRVLVSARVYDRQVGGNTRYVRAIYGDIQDHGVSSEFLRAPGAHLGNAARSAAYAALEGTVWPLRPTTPGSVLHFPADTGAVIRSRTPIVGTIHGLATLHIADVRSSSSDLLWRRRVRRLAKVSDRIITVSHTSAADIASFEPSAQDKIVVIHHGIDHSKFNTVSLGDWAETRARLNVPEEYLLYAGNLDPRKNVIELTKAARHVFKKTGVPLVISGSPAWESDEILRAVNETEGVLYVGRTTDDELIALMQNAVAFCFPSSYEGFGFPVLEAMACGVPVLCSTRGSLGEVAAGAALTLDSIDAPAIADAMMTLLEDPTLRAKLRDDGLRRSAEFQWSAAVEKHATVFKDLV